MKKPIIAIDVDDVLSATNLAMMHFANNHFGFNHTWEDYNAPGHYTLYWEDAVWKVGHQRGQECYDAFVAAGSRRRFTVVEGAVDALKQLQKRFELVVITARSQKYADETHAWLDQHFPDLFQQVHFERVEEDGTSVHKTVIAKEIGAQYLIDDSLEHCLPADATGVKCLLFGDYGWNNHQKIPASITRVKDWPAVLEYFNGQT
jgi:5'(3')-deoxyribonucleotidase